MYSSPVIEYFIWIESLVVPKGDLLIQVWLYYYYQENNYKQITLVM